MADKTRIERSDATWNAGADALDGPHWWIVENLCSVCAAKMQSAADPAYAGLYADDGPPELP